MANANPKRKKGNKPYSEILSDNLGMRRFALWRFYSEGRLEKVHFHKLVEDLSNDPTVKDEIRKAEIAFQLGRSPEKPDLSTPAKQFVWGAFLCVIDNNPDMVKGWQFQASATEPEISQSSIWQQLTGSVRALQESYATVLNADVLSGKTDNKIKFGKPGKGSHYIKSKSLFVYDLLEGLSHGFVHYRARTGQVISQSLLSNKYPLKMQNLHTQIRQIQQKQVKNKNKLSKKEYLKLRKLNLEWQMQKMFLEAAEGAMSAKNTTEISDLIYQDLSYSFNFFATSFDQFGPAKAPSRKDLDSNKIAEFIHLCRYMKFAFYDENGLVANDTGVKELGMDPKAIRRRKRFGAPKPSDNDFKDLDKRLRDANKGVMNLRPKVDLLASGTDYFNSKVKEFNNKRVEEIEKLWRDYAEHLAKDIIKEQMEKLEEEMDQNQDQDQDQSQDGQDQDSQDQDGPSDGEQSQDQDGEDQEQGQDDGGEPSQDGQEQDGQGDPSQQQDSQNGQPSDSDSQSQDGNAQDGQPQEGQSQDSNSQDGQQSDNNQNQDQNSQQQQNNDQSQDGDSGDQSADGQDTDPSDQFDSDADGQDGKSGDQDNPFDQTDPDSQVDVDDVGEMDDIADTAQSPEEKSMQDAGEEGQDGDSQDQDGDGQSQPQQGDGQDGQDGQDQGQSAEDLAEQIQQAMQEQDGQDQDGQDQDGDDNSQGDPSNQQSSDQAGEQKGKDKIDIVTDGWEDYVNTIAKLAGPISNVATSLKKIKELQIQRKTVLGKKKTILPKAGELDRFDLTSHRDLIVKRKTNQEIKEKDLERFSDDAVESDETTVDFILLVDGSGSMNSGGQKGSNGENITALDVALTTSAILYEASRKVGGIRVHVGMWGEGDVKWLIQPGDKRNKVGQVFASAKTGLHSGTRLSPAVLSTAKMFSEEKSKPGDLSGYTHVLVISDGDIGDAPDTQRMLEKLLKHSTETTVDFAILKQNGAGSSMEDVAKAIDTIRPVQKPTVAKKNNFEEMPLAIVKLLFKKVRQSGSFVAKPTNKKKSAMRRAYNRMRPKR